MTSQGIKDGAPLLLPSVGFSSHSSVRKLLISVM